MGLASNLSHLGTDVFLELRHEGIILTSDPVSRGIVFSLRPLYLIYIGTNCVVSNLSAKALENDGVGQEKRRTEYRQGDMERGISFIANN